MDKLPRWRNLVLISLGIVVLIATLSVFQGGPGRSTAMQLSDVAEAVKNGNVEKIIVANDELVVKFVGSRPDATSRKETGATIGEQLRQFGVSAEQLERVKIEVVSPFNWGDLINTAALFITPIIVILFFWFLFRQAQGANSQAMNFGRSRARMFTSDRPTVTFQDVAGADEAKQELVEVVEFLKEPEKFIQLGARIPKGVLLIGSPGTGKTLLAKAVSGEAGVPFFSISGSEFVEMFVGVGASRVRDLFEQAKRHSPCIVFIDEIDAVGRQRGSGLGGGHDEREQTLNQILVEMDGFDTDTNVIVIAATNRPDILDPALMRPGRFDRRVVLDRPDVKGREAILKVHVRGKPLAADVDLSVLAKATPGFAGADIENLVNEAAILAARRNRKSISMAEFTESIERVMMGPERKSRLITPKEKAIVAYHEAGHAIVGHLLENCDPIRKVTIIARGLAGGYTLSLPGEDRHYISRAKFLDDLAFALGGRVAEEIVFGDVTTGASSDLQRVTEIARDMVTRYGMSEKMGPIVYGQRHEMVFLGRDLGEQRDYSDAVAHEIDKEVQKLVNTAYARAREVLLNNRSVLEAIAKRLIEVETIEEEEFRAFFRVQNEVGSLSGNAPFNPRAQVPSRGDDKEETASSGAVPAPAPA
ncbi:MAG: ATP-dependent zinc metalloprotease FtsH [Anaerolineae bacterium]|nr:ATP-dependent zinc metalloprotease FtsH [Thermoflexales bacterium]MDW8406920.1 ATP-dependent zinc metalloprotease FtsH [Anaerolineae bacterium]